MSRSRKPSQLEPLGTLLRREAALRVPASVETSPVADRDWEAAVGTRIAARARPVSLERGVLLVRAASATWAQELALLSEAIVKQLRERGVAVRSLRFRVGKVDPPARPPDRAEVRTSPPDAPLPEPVKAELSRVADLDLRAAIGRAAAKNLGWQEAEKGRAKRPAARPAPAPAAAREPDPPAPSTSARPDARDPRSAASRTAPSDRSSPRSGGARRRNP